MNSLNLIPRNEVFEEEEIEEVNPLGDSNLFIYLHENSVPFDCDGEEADVSVFGEAEPIE